MLFSLKILTLFSVNEGLVMFTVNALITITDYTKLKMLFNLGEKIRKLTIFITANDEI